MSWQFYHAEVWTFPMQKWNPLWWVQNSREPLPPPDYRPTSRWRNLGWFLRNNFNNFKMFVAGIADKDHWVCGLEPGAPYKPGWNFLLSGVHVYWRPWVSHGGRCITWGFGWKPSGQLGAKWKITDSPWQVL